MPFVIQNKLLSIIKAFNRMRGFLPGDLVARGANPVDRGVELSSAPSAMGL